MIETVLFDLDGVIRQWDPRDIARAETETGLPSGSFWPIAFEPTLLMRAVTGQITDGEWRQETKGRLRAAHPEADADLAVQLWADAIGQVDEEVLDIVCLCRRTAAVALVTNATSRLDADLHRLRLMDEFDHIFNTSKLGVAKPDEALFQTVLQRMEVTPESTFFVDDARANVLAAQRLGIHAHLYEGAGALRRALREVGFSDGAD